MNFLGNTFQIGDFVAYPVRKGSSLWISFGIVNKLTKKRDEIRVGVIIVRIGKKNWTNEYHVNDLNPYADGSLKELFFIKVTASPDRMVRLNKKDVPVQLIEKINSKLETKQLNKKQLEMHYE